jgi:hypothetical protein
MYPPPRNPARQKVCLSALQGNFFGGGGLVNQLEKVAIAVDTTCSAKSNSGFDENPSDAVALQQHAKILSGHSNKARSIGGIFHLPFCEEVAS